MASVMSLAMMVFMVVPIIAPTVGQGILHDRRLARDPRWRSRSSACVMTVWCFLRLPETLADENRRPLRAGPVIEAFRDRRHQPRRLGLRDRHRPDLRLPVRLPEFRAADLSGDLRPRRVCSRRLLRGAILIAVASFTNSRLVERLGMRRLSHGALRRLRRDLGAALRDRHRRRGPRAVLDLLPAARSSRFGLFGFIGTNFNALAMDPLGHVAGTASSVVELAADVPRRRARRDHRPRL